MPNMHRQMKLSPEEETFLRHWMYDEVHYQEGVGLAKKLQLQHGVRPAQLAELIAAAIPNPTDQAAAGVGPPKGLLTWPWSNQAFHDRLTEARACLAERQSRAPIQAAD